MFTWLKPIPLLLSLIPVQLLGFIIVPIAALKAEKRPHEGEGGEDQWHFPKWAWLWDNHHDRHSHGIDGRAGFNKDGTPRERERFKNDWVRRVYWAAFRNRASNYGKMVLGVSERDATPIYEKGEYPSNREAVAGTYIARSKTTRKLGDIICFAKVWQYPFAKNYCIRMTYGWSLWNDNDDKGDKDHDWLGLQINCNPFVKFGGR